MSDDPRPYLSRYSDRHGKARWRFRRHGKTISMPGSPGSAEFEAAYAAALAGEPIRRATVHRLPGSAAPRSLRAAWRILQTTLEWKQLSPGSQDSQRGIAERFLTAPRMPGDTLTFGDVPVADLRRKHIKQILADRLDAPHAAAHLLRMLRKLCGVALDEEWIEYDPTYRIRFRPEYTGWKAWPEAARSQFEARWPVGTTPRLVYALALYFGHRRSDVARVRWADLEAKATNAVQQKTGKALWIPMHPELRAVIEATPRNGEYVVLSRYGEPYSVKALGMRMQEWTGAAGLAPGHTLHGLRKTLGKLLAEGGATTKQIMSILGHEDMAQAELYTREAEQKRLAAGGMRKISGRRRRTIG